MKILTWKVDRTIPTACPDYQPDPYTGEYPSFHCAVYHCKTITEERTAEFKTLKECKDFVFKAPDSCYNFKINGKSIKDNRKNKRTEYITISSDLITTGGTVTVQSGTNTLNQ